jgi:hypothetical protein
MQQYHIFAEYKTSDTMLLTSIGVHTTAFARAIPFGRNARYGPDSEVTLA